MNKRAKAKNLARNLHRSVWRMLQAKGETSQRGFPSIQNISHRLMLRYPDLREFWGKGKHIVLQEFYRRHGEELSGFWIPKKKIALPKDDFYSSRQWLTVRYAAILRSRGVCEACGATKRLHVDHIKPRSRYPELQLALTNLQVLCHDCNMGKSAWDETDWRKSA